MAVDTEVVAEAVEGATDAGNSIRVVLDLSTPPSAERLAGVYDYGHEIRSGVGLGDYNLRGHVSCVVRVGYLRICRFCMGMDGTNNYACCRDHHRRSFTSTRHMARHAHALNIVDHIDSDLGRGIFGAVRGMGNLL